MRSQFGCSRDRIGVCVYVDKGPMIGRRLCPAGNVTRRWGALVKRAGGEVGERFGGSIGERGIELWPRWLRDWSHKGKLSRGLFLVPTMIRQSMNHLQRKMISPPLHLHHRIPRLDRQMNPILGI